jgi:NADH-ubiquinone oxidoreductase chain 2
MSSSDLVSLYLAIELQSFGVYVLATLYRDSESATSAGLKYFFLGALSSALILLGSATVYSYAGVTNFEAIYSIATVPAISTDFQLGLVFGVLLILIGLLFKIAAAPFHSWAPDVYDGVPTIVTTWLTILPKISIFILLLNLQGIGEMLSLSAFFGEYEVSPWTQLLLLSALLSLVIGSVVGLAQYRIKRLLAYSTISHVGFMLLALATDSTESVESVLFYIAQYTITNLNVFFIVLAFGYILSQSEASSDTSDIRFIRELAGQFRTNPLLAVSFALCLFSMAGVPPLVGFFGKQSVLLAAMHSGYYFIALVAILTSVVSAYYYLRIVRTIFFDDAVIEGVSPKSGVMVVNPVHSFTIATLTLLLLAYVLKPAVVLNSMHLLGLSLYTL